MTAEVSAGTSSWASAFGLMGSERLLRQAQAEGFTGLVGRFFPGAPGPVLQWISDWTSWLFWHDDVCDETDVGSNPTELAVIFSQLFEVLSLSRSALPQRVFEVALEDMARRLVVLAPDRAWLLRFMTSVREYFDACLWEAENRARGVVPSSADFIPLRRCAGGMWIYLDFVELANGQSLPLSLRKHRDVQRLMQATNNVASWHNDIFSFSKERARSDVHNLVIVLQTELSLRTDEAIRLAARYADAEVHGFVAVAGKLGVLRGPELGAALESHVQGLRDLMRGNLDWSLGSARYTLDEPNAA